MKINYSRLILNLRGAGQLSYREISDITGIPKHKINRMANGGNYIPRDTDMIALLDCHLDHAPHLHSRDVLCG